MNTIQVPNQPGSYLRGPVKIIVTAEEIIILPKEEYTEVQQQPQKPRLSAAQKLDNAKETVDAVTRFLGF